MAEIVIDKIIRTRRKTAALHVLSDATLVVRVPYSAPEEYVRNLVKDKSEWILRKQEFFRQRAIKQSPIRYINGESFLFLGKEYTLEIISGTKPAVYVEIEGILKMSVACLSAPARYLKAWYIESARKYILPRVKLLANRHGFSYRSVRISGAASRWGSCGFRNTLNFSWRLMAAPTEVIDTVIAHELVHTEIKNHSKGFYKRLYEIDPQHRQSEKWLKENSLLRLE